MAAIWCRRCCRHCRHNNHHQSNSNLCMRACICMLMYYIIFRNEIETVFSLFFSLAGVVFYLIFPVSISYHTHIIHTIYFLHSQTTWIFLPSFSIYFCQMSFICDVQIFSIKIVQALWWWKICVRNRQKEKNG